jgi:subtilisin family serine protease
MCDPRSVTRRSFWLRCHPQRVREKGQHNEPIAVASVDDTNTLSFACGAVSVDLVAPSPNISQTEPDNGYGFGGGTSSSQPQVVGVAALLRILHRGWTYSQIKSQILSPVDLLPSLAGTKRSPAVV